MGEVFKLIDFYDFVCSNLIPNRETNPKKKVKKQKIKLLLMEKEESKILKSIFSITGFLGNK